MKLSVLFLICSLSMTYAAESYAQKTMISLEVRNETVGTVLEKLKKESGFDFFFNNKHVDLKRIVSVQRLWKKEVQTAQFLILTETLVFK